ncbi:hypothetical protein ALC56_10633 [Trachymyrmex septentrionalis]|uniref:Uncharacterized protein n=1 Tax=Trachymyrmex septentrionalis TaxID=34720 RepID=A0A195F3S4_9HYME|nr:hypothetical protein ALC56_10633 [Trachymyrmex septentrionalis]
MAVHVRAYRRFTVVDDDGGGGGGGGGIVGIVGIVSIVGIVVDDVDDVDTTRTQTNRARDEQYCTLPEFLSSCLPFVSALCTLRGTSGSCLHRPPPDGIRGFDSPPSNPVPPPELLPPPPRPDYAR